MSFIDKCLYSKGLFHSIASALGHLQYNDNVSSLHGIVRWKLGRKGERVPQFNEGHISGSVIGSCHCMTIV